MVLEKAESIEAHTPYIIKGKDGDTHDFSDYGMALQDQYAAGLNEVYIMAAHWAFIIPVCIGYIIRNCKEKYLPRTLPSVPSLMRTKGNLFPPEKCISA